MCVVSYVGDVYTEKIPWQYPWLQPDVWPAPTVTREELDDLRKTVEQMREELREAKKQDEAEGNADCEMAEKVELLRRVAELVGVSLEDVFPE